MDQQSRPVGTTTWFYREIPWRRVHPTASSVCGAWRVLGNSRQLHWRWETRSRCCAPCFPKYCHELLPKELCVYHIASCCFSLSRFDSCENLTLIPSQDQLDCKVSPRSSHLHRLSMWRFSIVMGHGGTPKWMVCKACKGILLK